MPAHDPRLFESHQDIIPIERIKDRHFTIVGCGSLGTVTGRILARLGGHRFHLIDGERVEIRHLNREVFSHDQVGTNKATGLAYQLSGIHPKVRAVTTAKPFSPDHLERGKEDIILLSSSDPALPQQVLDTVATWDDGERPALFVTRHTGLVGGYWYVDLKKESRKDVPDDLHWLVPTGRETSDARSRIATTAHVVSGILAQAIIDHILGHPLRERVDVDLGALVREDVTTPARSD